MQQPQPTREKILDNVFELVYIHGYNGTSMSMILKVCNIPKGSLYHYFPSKKAMVIAAIKERLAPLMDDFYDFSGEGEPLDIIVMSIQKVATKERLLLHGCPLNRLNQEMSPIDSDFEQAITPIYNHIKTKILLLLQKDDAIGDASSLSEFIIASVWGALSLSPSESSSARYTQTIEHLIRYLHIFKKVV